MSNWDGDGWGKRTGCQAHEIMAPSVGEGMKRRVLGMTGYLPQEVARLHLTV